MVRALLFAGSLLVSHSAFAADILVNLKEKWPVVAVVGKIEKGDADKFQRTVVNLRAGIVLFHSQGGSLIDGLRMGETIHQKKFVTGVKEGHACASACALAWLGGGLRFMDGKIGFHAASVEVDGEKREIGVGNAFVGAYVTRLGLSYSVVEYVTEASPDDIKWLTHRDAKKLGIAVADPEKYDKPAAPAPKAEPKVASLPKPLPTPQGSKSVIVASQGAWGFYVARSPTEGLVCYALTTVNGTSVMITTKPKLGIYNEFSFTSPYPLGQTGYVTASMNGQAFPLLTKGKSAWLADLSEESSLMNELQRGSELKVFIPSASGSKLDQTYNLEGLSAMLQRMQDCR